MVLMGNRAAAVVKTMARCRAGSFTTRSTPSSLAGAKCIHTYIFPCLLFFPTPLHAQHYIIDYSLMASFLPRHHHRQAVRPLDGRAVGNVTANQQDKAPHSRGGIAQVKHEETRIWGQKWSRFLGHFQTFTQH